MKSEDLIRSAEILRDNCKSYGDDDDCEGCPFAGKDTVCRLTSVIHPAEWDVYSGGKKTDSNHFREVTKKVEPERPAEVSKTITRADILDAANTNCESVAPTDTPTDTPTASVKTRQEKFLEMFPRAATRRDVLDICPGKVDTQRDYCKGFYDCLSCQKEYWLTAEKEDGHD